MSALVADTHATIWYLLGHANLSTPAREAMDRAAHEGQPIYVPAISLIEIVYLVEKGRLPADMLTRTVAALEDSAAADWQDVCDPATAEVLAAVPLSPPEEVDEAVHAAAEGFREWRRVPAPTHIRHRLRLRARAGASPPGAPPRRWRSRPRRSS